MYLFENRMKNNYKKNLNLENLIYSNKYSMNIQLSYRPNHNIIKNNIENIDINNFGKRNYTNKRNNSKSDKEANEIIIKTYETLYSDQKSYQDPKYSKNKSELDIHDNLRKNNNDYFKIMKYNKKTDIRLNYFRKGNETTDFLEKNNILEYRTKKNEKYNLKYNYIIKPYGKNAYLKENQYKIDLAKEINKLKKDYHKLNAYIKKLVANKKDLKSITKKLEAKLNNSKIAKDKNDKIIFDLNNKIKEFEISNDKNNNSNSNSNSNNSKESNTKEELLENKIEEMEEENNLLNKAIKEKDTLNQELNEEKNKLIKENNEFKEKIDEYITKVESLEKNNNKIKSGETQNENDDNKNKIKLLISENENLSKKNDEIIRKIDVLKLELKNKEEEISKLKDEVKLKLEENGSCDESKCRLELSMKEKIKKIENEEKKFQEELKYIKKKIYEHHTFNGKINNLDEFIKIFDLLFKNYKPEQREHKEAFKRIKKFLKI
jgi:hypothetical protein